MPWTAGAVLTASQLNTYLPQAWSSYTPTIAGGFTAGTTGASVTGRFIQYGKTVIFRANVTLGTSFTMGSGFGVSLPVVASATNLVPVGAHARFVSTGNNVYFGGCSLTASSATGFVVGTNGAAAALGYTAPFTWKATDTLEFAAVYEAA